MRDVSTLEINLSALDDNMRVLRGMVGPKCAICPVVKADAYGLGAARIAKRLAYAGAELLAVYTADQAAELFRAAIGARVLVLMPVRDIARVDELYRGLISDRLQLTVHDLNHVSDLIAITERYGVTISVHLEVDTGMGRGGCSMADAPLVLKRIAGCRRLRLAGVFTHFPSPDDAAVMDDQMAMFDGLLEAQASHIPADCLVHVAGTTAALRHARYHRTMVRIGLAWAGYCDQFVKDGEAHPIVRRLRPILTWTTRIMQVKTIPAGASVGYGARWTARRASVIGLVPVGYADGYPANLGARDDRLDGGAQVGVLVNGGDGGGHAHGEQSPSREFAPVIGVANMDQLTIDLTDVTGDVRAGTVVEMISPDVQAPNHLPSLARLAGMIPHELLCRLNSRLKRLYQTPAAGINELTVVPPRVAALAG